MARITLGGTTSEWVIVLSVALVLAVVLGLAASAAFSRYEDAEQTRWRPRPGPEQILRERYARGELSRRQYRDALIDVLKDRYVRDEIDLAEYEARLALLMREPRPPLDAASPPESGGEQG